MADGGIQINAEVLNGVFLAVLGLVAAYAVWVRAKAKTIEARAKTIEAEAANLNAQATKTLNDSVAELNERNTITDTLKQFSSLLNAQIVINQQLKERADQQEELYQKRLAEKEKRDEDNYRVLQQLQDRNHAEIHGVLKTRFDAVDATLASLPARLQEDNKTWVSTLVGELVAQMAEKFAEFTLSQEWYPFPDTNDREWREEFVKPLVGKVKIYRRPVMSDTSLTDVLLMAEGENMDIIQGRKKGWLVVRLLREKRAYYGWLPEHQVLTGLAAVRKTSEIAAVQTQPVPAT